MRKRVGNVITTAIIVIVAIRLPPTDDGGGVDGIGGIPTETPPYVINRVYVATTPVPTTTPASRPTSTPVPTYTPTPTPGPYGDVNGNPAPAPTLYPWADWDWRDFASHIVAGEVPSNAQAKRVVACTLIRDVLQGWGPYELKQRWYGWSSPTWDDRMAVWNALEVGGCQGLPWYRFVGSEADYQLWLSRGTVSYSDVVDRYGGTVAVR